jgi:cytochrome P450
MLHHPAALVEAALQSPLAALAPAPRRRSLAIIAHSIAAPPQPLQPQPLPPNPAGHLAALLSSRAPLIMAEWAEACGPVMRMRLGPDAVVIVSDPALTTKLLRRGPEYLPKARQIYAALEIGVTPRTPNMLSADDGALWKAVRAAVAPAFSATSLKQVLPRLLDLTRRTAEAVEAAGPGGEVDVADMAKKITSDVMGTLLFGEDLGGVEGK